MKTSIILVLSLFFALNLCACAKEAEVLEDGQPYGRDESYIPPTGIMDE